MNLDRVNQVLKKVNALIENLDDQGKTSAIERDLLLRYLRDMYEDVSNPKVISEAISIEQDLTPSAVVEPASTIAPVKNEVIAPAKQPIAEHVPVQVDPVTESPKEAEPIAPIQESQTTFYDTSPTPESKTVTASEEAPQVTQPVEAVINKFENPVQYFPPKEEKLQSPSANAPADEAAPVSQTEPTAQTASVKQPSSVATTNESASERFDSVFLEKSPTDIADKYQLQRVVTIEGAMGINERMQTINELFGGEHNVFMETVTHINNMTDFESARKYLIEGVAARYSWDSDNKLGMASEFVQLVRRKFA